MTADDSWQRFGHFIEGFAAASELLERAGNNGFFVEYVVLAASVVDGLLRTGLVLTHQIRTGSRQIPVLLIRQAKDDRSVSEREIYRQARREQVIGNDLFSELESLYEKRNRVVHRYIISDITTEEVLEIALAYEKIIPRVSSAVYALEEKQIRLGVGIAVSGPSGPEAELREYVLEISRPKHGKLADAIQRTSRYTDPEL